MKEIGTKNDEPCLNCNQDFMVLKSIKWHWECPSCEVCMDITGDRPEE